MWRTGVIIVLFILFVCFYYFIFRKKEEYTSRRNFDFLKYLKKTKNKDKVKIPIPKHTHNIDTNCFPSLPEPLYSYHHLAYTAEILQGMEQCEKCPRRCPE